MMDESEIKYTHARNILRNSKDTTLDHDIDDYEDSRIELKAIGHNLVSGCILTQQRTNLL